VAAVAALAPATAVFRCNPGSVTRMVACTVRLSPGARSPRIQSALPSCLIEPWSEMEERDASALAAIRLPASLRRD
jgi:hypothetical protein